MIKLNVSEVYWKDGGALISKENLKLYCQKVKDTKDGGFDCLCNCHDDHNPSFHWEIGRVGWVGRCKTCSAKGADFAKTAGIKVTELFADTPNTNRASPGEQYIRKKYNRHTLYDYFSFIDELYDHTKIRYYPGWANGDKKFANGYWGDNGRFNDQKGCLKDRKPQTAIFGNVALIKKCIAEKKVVYYCEGEKDVQAMQKLGYPAFTQGSCTTFYPELAPHLKGIRLIILADNDTGGQNGAKKLRELLLPYAESIKVITPCTDFLKADVTDFFKNHDKSDFERLIAENTAVTDTTVGSPTSVTDTTVPKGTLVNVENVRSMLMYKVEYDKDGSEKSRKLIQSVKNFEIALDNDSRLKGKIKFDEFSQQTYLMGNTPWETSRNNYRAWSSFDDSALFAILQSDYGLNSRNDYFDALKNVAMRNRFHPVRDLLNSLKWDGREHIRGLLPDYLGAEDTEYTYQVWRLWMLGAVARIFHPGCKFDYTVIFQGRQGLGKSTFLQLMALNDGWFNDSLDSLDSDKAAQSLMGSWIIELAELKSLARTAGGVDSVKRFLTAVQDKIRLPYERRADIFLRQSVFAGTTNKSDFLQDETGNRRFLIIQTGVHEPKKNLFDPEAMRDIKAAWAEAVHIYKIEKPKLLLPESCRKQAEELQAESMSDDGKIGIIQEYLSDKHRTCAIEIWQKALGEQGRPAKWQASEISNIILGLPEWERIPNPTKFGEYGSQRGFQRKTTNTLPEKDCSSKSGDCSNDFMKISESEFSELPFD